MKIALAFFGQPRGLNVEHVMGQWEHIVSNSWHDIDVYAHFWDTMSNTKVSETYEQFVVEEKVESETYFANFFNTLNPLSVEIQGSNVLDELSWKYFHWNRSIYKRVDPGIPSTGRATLGQWYSTERVLTTIADSENDYDFVVRIRPDVLFLDGTNPYYFDDNIINNFARRRPGYRAVGTSSMSVIKGTPVAGDWWTVMSGDFVKEFSEGLTAALAVQFNAIFSEPMDPYSVQENAFHRHLIKHNIDAMSVLCNSKIYREDDEDRWNWPNFAQ